MTGSARVSSRGSTAIDSGFELKIRTKIRRYGEDRASGFPNHHWAAHLTTEPFGAAAPVRQAQNPCQNPGPPLLAGALPVPGANYALTYAAHGPQNAEGHASAMCDARAPDPPGTADDGRRPGVQGRVLAWSARGSIMWGCARSRLHGLWPEPAALGKPPAGLRVPQVADKHHAHAI